MSIMRSIAPLFLLLLFFTSLFGQNTSTQNFKSKELQASIAVQIYIPRAYKENPSTKYPVTIVLDSDYLFDIYVSNSKLYAYANNAPKQIIVGLEMKNTGFEDTSMHGNDSSLTTSHLRIVNFMKKELVPHIKNTYNTAPFTSIVGSGISAAIIPAFLKDEKPLFNAYILLNPKLEEDINTKMHSYNLEKLADVDVPYYFHVSDNDFLDKKREQNGDNLATYLKNLTIENFHVSYDVSKYAANTISSIGQAVPKSLDTLFELYSGISKEEFNAHIKDVSPEDAVAYLKDKYSKIEHLFGVHLDIREADISAIESIIIEKEDGDYLKEFGEMVLTILPKSQLGHYYVGRYYESGKNYAKALEHYKYGYSKMDSKDPNAERFYNNISRLLKEI